MINQDKIKQAVQLLLEGMGEDVNRPGLKETPERIARMWTESLGGVGEEGGGEVVKGVSGDSR